MTAKKQASPTVHPAVLILVILAFILLCVGAYLYAKRGQEQATGKNKVVPTATPTMTKLYPDEGTKGTYNVSSSQKTGPRITKVSFDPFNAVKGQPLTLAATITNDVPVQKVTGEFTMDNTKINLVFAFVSRTDKTEIWQTTLSPLPDSVNYKYSLSVKAESTNGSGVGGASPRSR